MAVGLLIPLYVDPPGTPYTTIISLMGTYPNVPCTVILNPNSGPGGSAQAVYTTAISQLKSAGATVLGYVETGYGILNHDQNPQNETTIKTDVSNWHSFYPAIQGIFFDEMDDTAGTTSCTSRAGGNCVGLYQDLYTYVYSFGMNLVIGNPGENTISSYFSSSPSAADVYCINETDTTWPSLPQLNNSGLGTNASRASIAYGVTYNKTNFLAMAQYANLVWTTNDTDPNPYDTIPTSLSTMFADLSAYNTSLNPSTNISYGLITASGPQTSWG